MTTVLVVDDEPQIVRTLRINLTARGYQVIIAAAGASALRAAAEGKPDVVVLDLGLPNIDGVQVIEGLRGWTAVPIVVLSARIDSPDKVQALDAGADDYVTKPFGMDELLARLRAAVRRATTTLSGADDAVIHTAAFAIDLAAKKVHRDGTEVQGPEYATETHHLRVYLAQLRRKLEPHPSHPRYLITESGMGYRLEA